ncbi:GldG family protein [bacterium]|nr:GldG family protein [bacterium]
MKKSVWINVIIILVIVIIINLISLSLFHRFDKTKDKIFSLSEVTKQTLENLEDRLVVKAYFSADKDLPPNLKDARRYAKDLLTEYSSYSKGQLKFEFISPDKDEELKKEAEKHKIPAVTVNIVENDNQVSKLVYLGFAFLYQGKIESIPVVYQNQGLEYEITLTLKKLISKEQKKIAVFRNDNITRNMFGQEIDHYADFTNTISESYEIVRSDLSQPLPDDISGLFITGITDSLSTEQLYNLDQYIMKGGSVALFQDKVQADINSQQAQVINTNLFDLLSHYGINIKQNLIGDANCSGDMLSIRQGNMIRRIPLEAYPFNPIITSFNDDAELVKNIDVLSLKFPSELDNSNIPPEIEFTPLMFSSKNTKRATAPRFDIGIMSYYQKNLEEILTEEPATLAGIYRGKFKSYFADNLNFEDRIAESAESKIIILADSDLLFVTKDKVKNNYDFLLNTIDTIAGEGSLIQLRSRGSEFKPIKKEIADSKSKKGVIKWTNILLPSFLLILFGLLSYKLYDNKKKRLEKKYE